MKLHEVARFEIDYQLRRVSTWIYFAILAGLTFLVMSSFIDDARRGEAFFNAPLMLAGATVITSTLALLALAAVAGDAATRDMHTRMEPLLYTSPVGKAGYLGGRFLGAFAVNALLLAAVPLALLLVLRVPGIEPEILGPFRPAAYLGAYFFVALPNAFVATAILFSLAALTRRAIVSYAGAAVLFLTAMFSRELVAATLGRWELAKHLDLSGFTAISALWRSWTTAQKNTQLLALDGALLSNRLLWLAIAASVLAILYFRFRFTHPGGAAGFSPPRHSGHSSPVAGGLKPTAPPAAEVAMPRVHRTFDLRMHARQTLAVALRSFREIVTSRAWIVFPAAAVMLVLIAPEVLEVELGTPSLPVTMLVLELFAHPGIGILVAALTTLYAGELVWRERDMRLSAFTDVVPVPDWVTFCGKFAGLALMLVVMYGVLMVAGMVTQGLQGSFRFEPWLYVRVLFGFHLTGALQFAAAAMCLHVLVNQKYVGNMVVFLFYLYTMLAHELGIEHNLLIFGGDPGWSYSDMSGFGASLAPWLWFNLYWTAWALLLAVIGIVFWPRGSEEGARARVALARSRFTRLPVAVAATAVALIAVTGGFIFYNTNVLNAYHSDAGQAARRVRYERLYAKYESVPQPELRATKLHVDIDPRGRKAVIRGEQRLVNRTARAIDSVHLSLLRGVEIETGFDRPVKPVLADEDLGYRIYALPQPLQPGESLRLRFDVRHAPRGFTNGGRSAPVIANGTYFEPWLPLVGYQRNRELSDAGARRKHGLPPRTAIRSLHDVAARRDMSGRERIEFEAVVGTDEDQIGVAPGTLRRTWTSNGRRYFHYVADAPIRNAPAIFSARYAVHETRSNGVQIQVFHHPSHAWNVERMMRSARASLDYYTRNFGPYPHRHLRLIEVASSPGGFGMRAYPGTIMFSETFAFVNPKEDDRDLDLPFAVVAHEVAHQWWAHQVVAARVEGAPVLAESLAWYSGMMVVEKTYGREHLRRLLAMMRREYLTPRAAADVPLLRATDDFDVYRRGPFAMYTLREYLGEERVNAALRRLVAKHGSGEPPLPTSLDLYAELQAAAPEPLRDLVRDLFEKNTFWDLEAKAVRAEGAGAGEWRVSIDVAARKVTTGSSGAETVVPMNDFVEVGVFAENGEPLYLQKHRVRSGTQTITVVVRRPPARAGIDPHHKLIETKHEDNEKEL